MIYVVLGATGHIGSATAESLLRSGHHVRVVTRSATKAAAWAARGAEPAIVDIEDTAAMARVLSGDAPIRVFALNPPGSVTGDPDAEEERTADAIVGALDAARVERVVALSTYGARAGHRIGDLGTLHRFEQLVQALSTPVATLRAGYLYSNWDGATRSARSDGEVAVMLDPARPLPMVAPLDVGVEAARLLRLEDPRRGVFHVEGPHRYTPDDVARILSSLVGRPVVTVRTPPDAWRTTFLAGGFSAAAADSFTGLTTLVDRETWNLATPPIQGAVTLEAYLSALVDQP